MLKILVVGGYDPDEDKDIKDDIIEFSRNLARKIIQEGHILLNGCLTELDKVLAEAAYAELEKLFPDRKEKNLISYNLDGVQPVHQSGTIIKSRLRNWDISGDSVAFIPEPIERADVIILIKGFDGTSKATFWARSAQKPLLPVTYFEGIAKDIYQQEYNDFDKKYFGRVEKIDYEILNQVGNDWQNLARKVVALAQDIAVYRSVAVLMPNSDDPETEIQLKNIRDAYESVCNEYGYNCRRVEESVLVKRIIPQIFDLIKSAAFIIADLTELKHNVFYELGFAHGIEKKVIVTAREGIELPFNVKDVPTIFWNPIDHVRLKKDLREKVEAIARTQGWNP